MNRPTPPQLPALTGRTNYRERVADALRAALIAGRLLPREVHSAPALAARFGVSATPVREAMLDLVREGLVTAVPNKGFRITEVTERQLDEYLHIRALIEIPTVTALTSAADPSALEALRPVADEIVTRPPPATSSAMSRPTAASTSGCSPSPGTGIWSRWSATCANAPGCTD